jgi:macrolide transport system ATP-binding/permease protein
MDTFLRDIRYSLRVLLKHPGFTAVAIATLALGIGINTSIFTVFNALALRPLSAKDPGSLVRVYESFEDGTRYGSSSYPDYVDFRDQNNVFSGLVAYTGAALRLGEGNDPNTHTETFQGALVSGNFFSVLGADAIVGRTFISEEDKTPGSHPVTVLSYGLWQRQFGSDPGVVGKTLILNFHPYTVVGVAPKWFTGLEPTASDLWVPMMMEAEAVPGRNFLNNRNSHRLKLVGRLKPGVTLKQAEAQISTLADRLDQTYNQPVAKIRKVSATLAPASLLDPNENGNVIPIAFLMMAGVGLVLVIACANLANLLLSRAASRQREIGIRLSLGATRGRLIRQLLTESTVLSLGGGITGLLLTFWITDLLIRFVHPPGESPLAINVSPDVNVFLYTLVISLLAGVAFGLLPSMHSTKLTLTSALKDEGTPFGQGISRSRLRSLLVGAQVAVSLVLLIGAGLLVRALHNAQSTDPGFAMKDVLVLSPDLRLHGYNPARAAEFDDELVDKIQSLPGVKSVGMAWVIPLGSSISDTNVEIEGHETPPGKKSPFANVNFVSGKYFDALGIPMVRGRTFTKQEMAKNAPVALINESFARRFWPGVDPIGKRFNYGIEIVGVVKDTRSVYLWSSSEPIVYRPVEPDFRPDMKFFVRTDGGSNYLATTLPGVVGGIDGSVQTNVKTLEDNLQAWLWPSRMGAMLSAALGVLAILLASVGIYGVTAYAVSQRTHEIGIRLALGAERRDVLHLVLRQGMRPVLAGLAFGLILSIAASQLLAKFLYGLSAVDAVTFAIVPVVLAAVAALANYLPARRAAKVDPMVALRYE